MKIALVVPAAGSGERLAAGVPKALVEIAGVPLVVRTLVRLAEAAQFDETVVLAPVAAIARFEQALRALPASFGPARVLAGGATRQQSVAAGVRAAADSCDVVCVHDAARPLVSVQTVREVLECAAAGHAATAASRMTDSVREERNGGSIALDRTRLWLVETPQAFPRRMLVDAHRRAEEAGAAYTDDASLAEAAGHSIRIVESLGRNIKVTLPADVAFAAEMFRRP